MLDTGVHATLEDLARAKGAAPCYVSRVVRVTLLAPEVVEAILDGRQPRGMRLADLLDGFPEGWPSSARAHTCAVVSDRGPYTQSDVPEDLRRRWARRPGATRGITLRAEWRRSPTE